MSDLTPSRLRDFLSRSYLEKACGSGLRNSKAVEHRSRSTPTGIGGDPGAEPVDQVPEPFDLLDSIEGFFKWVGLQGGAREAGEIMPILLELRESLPRALAITTALSNALKERGGAFHFPEFLTSFEEGGSSQYDIDAPGNVGAIDGYFRIVRVESQRAEAKELISEERVWPIVFPSGVAALLDSGYVLSLELVRDQEGWQIAGCGFVYPPGTEI
jgi:hypothetical protein